MLTQTLDDQVPIDAYLAAYPRDIVKLIDELRDIVRSVAPNAVERIRAGWQLIGYDMPVGRRLVYFAYVAPESIHAHIGFPVGTLMEDPGRLLEGAHLKLKKYRYLTFRPGERVPRAQCATLVLEAARVASLPRAERLALAVERAWAPDQA